MNKFSHRALTMMVFVVAAHSGMVQADSRGCEEGIIRLPDRNGTIEICSAVSAQVPKLSRQLTDAVKTMGDQQKQIAELTRLVKNFNRVGRDIDPSRQASMIAGFSQELEKSQRSGEDRTRRTLQDLSDRFEDIQNQLTAARATPKGAAEIAEALNGPVGDSISRLELNSASRQLDAITARLTAIEGKVDSVKDDTQAIRSMLKNIATEVGQLGKQGGLIDNASSYSAYYHNARLLAQRGEMDRAMEAYAKVFKTGIPFADPIIDVTTLLTRQYGQEGARIALEKQFKDVLSPAGRLYGLQLLSEEPMDEIETLYWKDRKAVIGFPPLMLLYLKRSQLLLEARIKKHQLSDATVPQDYFIYAWLDWTMFAELDQQVREQISSGNYLAYFIDPLRGNIDAEASRSLKKRFSADRLFNLTLGNWSVEKNAYRTVNLRNSPVVLDYTYFDRKPKFAVQHDSLDYYQGGRPLGSVHLFIWDGALDWKEPILACVQKDGKEHCTNLNESKFLCKKPSWGDQETRNCILDRGFQFHSQSILKPNLDAHFSALPLLGASCISRIEYHVNDSMRRTVTISGKDIVATYRDVYNPGLSKEISACSYDLQLNPPPPDRPPEEVELSKIREQVPVFAKASPLYHSLPPSAENCQRITPSWRVSNAQEMDLHESRLPYWLYMDRVAAALKTAPQLPHQKKVIFNAEKRSCRIFLWTPTAPYACEV